MLYLYVQCFVLFDKQLIELFGDSKQMLLEGSRYFAVMAFFYWLPGVTNAHQGFFARCREK